MRDFRVGTGFDVHSFAPERKLILGGVAVPYHLGLMGHSDADVLVHAMMDALLGAAGLPDIGNLFPDSDPDYAGADSVGLLAQVWRKVRRLGWSLSNIDSVIMAEQPKLKVYIPEMIQKLAMTLEAPVEKVNIKATTTEHLGFVGRGEGVAAQAVVLIYKGT